MEQKDDIRKELNDLAPKLANLKKDNPFKVPDYYFQGLPDKLLERAKAEPVPLTERIEAALNGFFSRIFQPRYAVTFATCLVVVAVSIGYLKNRETATVPGAQFSVQFSKLSTEAIDTYILNNFDDYELVAFNGNGANATPAAETMIPADMTTEELNDYLNETIENQIIEEEYL